MSRRRRAGPRSSTSTFAGRRRSAGTSHSERACELTGEHSTAGTTPASAGEEADGTAAFRGQITLDGPSGTGKSSVARGVAARLGAAYLDTGAMYRAATVAVLDAAVDPEDADAVARAVDAARIEVGTESGTELVLVDGMDVATRIRGAEVTRAVSAVSAVPAVRRRLVGQQRALVAAAGAVVVEGRDIGTVVLPDATLKIYLTAAPEGRAQRRGRPPRVTHPGGDAAPPPGPGPRGEDDRGRRGDP